MIFASDAPKDIGHISMQVEINLTCTGGRIPMTFRVVREATREEYEQDHRRRCPEDTHKFSTKPYYYEVSIEPESVQAQTNEASFVS